MHFIRHFFKKSSREKLETTGAAFGDIDQQRLDRAGGGSLVTDDMTKRKKEWLADRSPGRSDLLKSSPSKTRSSRTSTPSGSQTSMSTIIEGRPGVMMREVKKSSSRHVAQVLPGLILGSQEISQDAQGLKRYGVTHILNVTTEVTDRFPDKFVYKRIPVSDMPSTQIRQHFDDAFRFIDDARGLGGCVLVHCYYGNSRSASFIIAYVMRSERMRFCDALEYLHLLRPEVHPNDGFERQLLEYDRAIFT